MVAPKNNPPRGLAAVQAQAQIRTMFDVRENRDMAEFRGMYANRNFSKRTVDALIDSMIDAPERLLILPEEAIQKIKYRQNWPCGN